MHMLKFLPYNTKQADASCSPLNSPIFSPCQFFISLNPKKLRGHSMERQKEKLYNVSLPGLFYYAQQEAVEGEMDGF